ncbi:hypothetical protein GW17_00033389 [Ensete ventricosum]|nr:hypothetical protein GW17_00033389 [Ensete ventricosum]
MNASLKVILIKVFHTGPYQCTKFISVWAKNRPSVKYRPRATDRARESRKSSAQGIGFSLFFFSRFFFLPQLTANGRFSIVPPGSKWSTYKSVGRPVRTARYEALPLSKANLDIKTTRTNY